MANRLSCVAAVILSAAVVCACSDELVREPADPPEATADGKADRIDEEAQVFIGRCAASAPVEPYAPVPDPTRAQPDGPGVLLTRVGVPVGVYDDRPTRLQGDFARAGCGRHYFVFTLRRRAELSITGTSTSDGRPSTLGICFLRPHFLRIDAPWFGQIWQKENFSDPAPPCGGFVPVGDRIEPAGGEAMILEPGTYELTFDQFTVERLKYDVALDFSPLDDAVCGDGVVQGDEMCDDGNQDPLDWCGADCRPQRLDVEPLPGNETLETAQPLDGFRHVRFHAMPQTDEVDVYSIRLDAGETLVLTKGARTCHESTVRLFGPSGDELHDPWECADMVDTVTFTTETAGEYFLRVETSADGARSISAIVSSPS